MMKIIKRENFGPYDEYVIVRDGKKIYGARYNFQGPCWCPEMMTCKVLDEKHLATNPADAVENQAVDYATKYEKEIVDCFCCSSVFV